MNELTLIIPAKNEKESLPKVLQNLKRHNYNVIVSLKQNDLDTINSIKNFDVINVDTFSVKKEEWHQLFNPYKEECRIIEIQFGEENSEEDIERIKYYDGNE